MAILTQRFDKFGRPIDDDGKPIKDGESIRVPIAFMDNRPDGGHNYTEGDMARDAYIERLTGFAPRAAIKPQPMRDSGGYGASIADAQRTAARDAYVSRVYFGGSK